MSGIDAFINISSWIQYCIHGSYSNICWWMRPIWVFRLPFCEKDLRQIVHWKSFLPPHSFFKCRDRWFFRLYFEPHALGQWKYKFAPVSASNVCEISFPEKRPSYYNQNANFIQKNRNWPSSWITYLHINKGKSVHIFMYFLKQHVGRYDVPCTW